MNDKRERDSPSNNSPPLKKQGLSYEKIFVPDPDTQIIMLNTDEQNVKYFSDLFDYHGVADACHDGLSGRGAIIKSNSNGIRTLIQKTNLGTGTDMNTNGKIYSTGSSVHDLNDMLNRNLSSNKDFLVNKKQILLPPPYKGDYNQMINNQMKNNNVESMPGYTYFFKNYHIPKGTNREQRDYKTHGSIIKKFTGIQSEYYVLDCGQRGLHQSIAINGEKQQLSGKLDSSSSSGSSQSGAKFCLPFMYIYTGQIKVGVIMYGAEGTGSVNPNVYFKYFSFDGTDMKNINDQCKTFNSTSETSDWIKIPNLDMVPTLPDVLNMFTFTNVIRDCFNSIFNKKKLQDKKQSCRPFMEVASKLFGKIGTGTVWVDDNISFIKAFLLCVKKFGDISRVVDNEINRTNGIDSFTGTSDTFLTNFACLCNLSIVYSNDGHTLVINDPPTEPSKAAEMKLAQEEKEAAISAKMIEIGRRDVNRYSRIFDIFNDNYIIRISRISDPLGRIPQQRQAKAINALLKVSFMLKKKNSTLELKYSFEQLFLLWKINQILITGAFPNKTLPNKKLINKGNFILLLINQKLDYNNELTLSVSEDKDKPNILNDLLVKFINNEKIEDLKNLFGNSTNLFGNSTVKEGGLYDIVDNYYTDLGNPTVVNPNDFFRQGLLAKIRQDKARQDKASGKIVPASGGAQVKAAVKTASKATGNPIKATLPVRANLQVNTISKQRIEANIEANIDKLISNIDNLHIDYWGNGKINENDYDKSLIKEQISLFTNLYHLNKHISLIKTYITIDTINIENPNTNEMEKINQKYIIKYYDFLKPYLSDTSIYNDFFQEDHIHTLYKRTILQIEDEVDTQNNRIQIPGTMRTGLTGIQPLSRFSMKNASQMTVGGKKKTRKHKKKRQTKNKKTQKKQYV